MLGSLWSGAAQAVNFKVTDAAEVLQIVNSKLHADMRFAMGNCASDPGIVMCDIWANKPSKPPLRMGAGAESNASAVSILSVDFAPDSDHYFVFLTLLAATRALSEEESIDTDAFLKFTLQQIADVTALGTSDASRFGLTYSGRATGNHFRMMVMRTK
ncbi:hypothetical protein DYH55_02485 [Methylovirgula sp. 4M-Z18]|nr:hypothetical protein DYH55_02485 [Methylovirgula sp. 4M-Z18]